MQQVMRWTRAIVALALVATTSPAIVAQESGKLKVTVDYKGAGTVDATHEIFVWVFDTPNIGADSVPLANDVVTTNGGTLSFSGLPKEVYLAAAFDEKGDYDGTSGPPPPRHADHHLRRDGRGQGRRHRRCRRRRQRHVRRHRPHALTGRSQAEGHSRLRRDVLPQARPSRHTFRSFVTRPISTHSTTKMLPA